MTTPPAPRDECRDCALLPPVPAGMTFPPRTDYIALGYRPPRPAPVQGGPRSRRCLRHRRAHTRAGKATAAAGRKANRYGMDRALQRAVWIAQGRRCPCGAKVTPVGVDDPPAGVHTDHDHDLAATHDHDDDRGCLECTLGFLCSSCNRDIVGGLTGRFIDGRPRGRAGVPAALRALADFLDDPPLRRVLAELDDGQAAA